ncbi:uncharacterized protein LOC143213025 isoform X4 [Lasioglossum baleicum]|uniref:uncharacterized protein LOC143213025 isoform X4 n=1 Tax=Lasioglossum baleicum TaxID=434251 RepID=UPI003FCE012B
MSLILAFHAGLPSFSRKFKLARVTESLLLTACRRGVEGSVICRESPLVSLGRSNARDSLAFPRLESFLNKLAACWSYLSAMHKCAESASTPPVPPRRKKRKAKFAGTVKPSEGTSPTSLRKLERKRLAPPPPPPPPRATRRVKPHIVKRHRDEEEEEAISNGRPIERSGETLSSLSPAAREAVKPLSRQFEDADLIPTKETSNGTSDKNRNDARNAAASNERAFPLFDTLSRQEPDKYPPLLFTLHDFQNVMANSLPREEDSRTGAIVQLVSTIRESFHESFEHSLDDEEGDMCFRVTTTNLPFEKCLNRWGTTFADNFIDDPNCFVFEDYIDRSSKLNIRRSTGPMCYSDFEDPPAVPRLTKVRFVIQSPSSSTPDHDLSEDGDAADNSLENIGPLADQETADTPTVQLTEILDSGELEEVGHVEECRQNSGDSDEFGDVPFNTVLETRNDEIPFEYTCTSIDLADRESSDESDDAGAPPKDSRRGSTFAELQDQSFDPSYSVNALQSAESPSAGASALDELEETWRRGAVNDDRTASDVPIDLIRPTEEFRVSEDKIEHRIQPYSSEGLFEDASSNFRSTEATVSSEALDDVVEQKLTIEKRLIGDQGVEASEEKLTINQTIIDNDRTSVTNDVGRRDSFSKSIEISASEKALSVENQDDERVSTESSNKSCKEYKRKIFVSESLRNMVVCNDFSSNDSADDSHIPEAKDIEPITTSSNKLDGALEELHATSAEEIEKDTSRSQTEPTSDVPVRRVVSVPVSIRRNSFLENMLCEDEAETWTGTTSCKIVAAHPKSSVMNEEPIEEESKAVCQLVDSIKTGMVIHKALSKFKENPKKIEVPVARPRSPMIIQPAKKHAGEAKCDVLNELLSNFSNIRLRPVNNEKHGGSDGILQANESKEFSSSATSYARDNQIPTKSSHISREMQISDESSEKPERFSFAASATEFGSLASLCRNTEVVKVDVHRSELGDDEDNDWRASKSMLETRRMHAEKTDRSVESCAVSVQVAGCSEKTDAKDRNDEGLDDCVPDDAGPAGEQLDLSRRTGSGARSAIARRIPRPHCNNNDNNRAVTPVAVSDDQSRDTVTITPGRVRSFVKYYEIRREATTDNDSKTNDRDKLDRDQMPGHRSVTSIRRGLEAKAIESSESRKDAFHVSILDSAVESTGTKGRSAITEVSTVEEKNWCRPNDPEATEDPESKREEETLQTSPGGSTPHPDDGPVGSSAIQVTKSPRKRKAPDRPMPAENPSRAASITAERKEWLDTDAWVFDKRDIAAQIEAAAGRGECSGINSFVPNPDTPRLVFYCTV